MACPEVQDAGVLRLVGGEASALRLFLLGAVAR
jgi:hypothetical protein